MQFFLSADIQADRTLMEAPSSELRNRESGTSSCIPAPLPEFHGPSCSVRFARCCPSLRFRYTAPLVKSLRSTIALLLLNVAWLAVLSWFLAKHFGSKAGETQIQYVTNYVAILEPAVETTPATNVLPIPTDFRWAQLESEDYRAYIARLRAIGCPEQTIRDIVIADVDKLLAPKLQAANPRARDAKFWQPLEQELWEDAEQKDALRKQREVDFEKREVIRQLLGLDLVGERLRVQGQEDYYGQRLAFLPEEKRARVRTVLDQFADQERALLERQVEEGNTPAGSEDFVKLRQEKNSALDQLLAPQERQQYDLWFSPSASAVRDSVYGLNASEEEFTKLYQLHRSFVGQQGENFGPWSQEWGNYEQKVRETLGEQRFAEYRRAQDNDYRELLRTTSRFKISPEVAAQLYSYKQPVEEARAQVLAEQDYTPQQRAAAFKAITAETQQVLREALGEKAFRYYDRRTGNNWVRGGSLPATAP